MLYLIPTTLLACIATFFLGYHFRGLTKKVEHLEEVIQTKVSKPVVVLEGPQSDVLDPLDEIQEAQYQHRKMMERLNPNG
jgi:hypothetical protein